MSESRKPYLDSIKIPKIYGYTTDEYKKLGYIKVGYTTQTVDERMKQHFPTLSPNEKPYEVVFTDIAQKDNGELFKDVGKGGVHEGLLKIGCKKIKGEFYQCTVEDIKNVVLSIKKGQTLNPKVTENFKMRPEQIDAVERTSSYFKNQFKNSDKTPRFLWNAKMRFGKTFTSYQLAKKMKWKRVMVLTWQPAVENEWRSQLESHLDFQDFQFYGKNDSFDSLDLSKPIIWFSSFQDILGKNPQGGTKEKFEEAHKIHWDCAILDEYHFGAWNENSQELFLSDKSEPSIKLEFKFETYPLNTKCFLALTGTPFRALREGDFLEDQIFNWSYIDEQKAKESWNKNEINPYLELPKMVMMTYEMPSELKDIALKGENNEFDLNEFFKAEGSGKDAKFVYENEVQKWLSLIRGQYLQGGFSPDSGIKNPPLPYEDKELLDYMNHSFWFLPRVNSCEAMKNLLESKKNVFFHDYKVLLAAGKGAGVGLKALPPVLDAIDTGFETKTITLSCRKLATGVTVPQWGAVFMLRNLNSPETYFQTAFRAQSPWRLKNIADGSLEIIKNKCYIFDFAPNRALKLIENYSTKLDIDKNKSILDKVTEFLNFLPVLQYDNFSMKPLDAKELLSFAASGVGATMLARRWQSSMLVRVDNDTLERLLSKPDILEALENIEAFKNLNKDLTTVINSEKALSKLEKERKPKSKDDKKQEKKNKSFRKELKEKLIKFITRVPHFMYLTDYREESLKDVIMQLETGLFTKVTGLEIEHFEELCNVGVFNSQIMDYAIYSFRKYEEASLSYIGGGKETSKIGLFDTSINKIETL